MKESQVQTQDPVRRVEDLQSNWTYRAEPMPLRNYARYCWRMLGVRPAPTSLAIKPVTKQERWIAYFMFAPDGRLQPYHEFTLARLREQNTSVLVVVASHSKEEIPPDLQNQCDALYWKALSGYDFSAYTVALTAVARHSPGADVLVFNDSVYGPFSDLDAFLSRAPWDLTGFTAGNVSRQTHIQSYAFILKNVTPARLESLRSIFRPSSAFNSANGAISCQELWLARVASRSMSVGSFWYGEAKTVIDPSLSRGVELLQVGFPFLKRSLQSKHTWFQQADAAVEQLQRLGHPL